MELREKNKICENTNQWRIEKKLWNWKQTQDWLTQEKEPDYGRWEPGQGQWYHRVCCSEQPLLTSLETQAHLFFKNIFSIHVTFMNSQIVFFSWKGLYSFIHLKSRRRQWRRGGKERERREKEGKREGDREGEREGEGGEGKGQDEGRRGWNQSCISWFIPQMVTISRVWLVGIQEFRSSIRNFHMGGSITNTWAIICFPARCISREMDQKQSNWGPRCPYDYRKERRTRFKYSGLKATSITSTHLRAEARTFHSIKVQKS